MVNFLPLESVITRMKLFEPNDEDISPINFKAFQWCRKKTVDQASLWLDVVYFGLFCQDTEDLPLDLTSGEYPPLDLIFEEQKASVADIQIL